MKAVFKLDNIGQIAVINVIIIKEVKIVGLREVIDDEFFLIHETALKKNIYSPEI
jgi:hypothetical protein